MKKIVNGRVYDTDTAKKLGYWERNVSSRDFYWCKEVLFQKRTGEYFLYGVGGPETKYRVREGGMFSGGAEIIPLTFGQAKQWAEEHLDADEYADIFGIVEDDSHAAVNLSMSTTAIETARRRAAEQGVTLSAYIEALIK